MSVILIVLIIGWIAKRFFEDRAIDADRKARDTAKIDMYRDAVRRSPQSASIHESLGDAFREAERYAEALHAYNNAQALIDQSGAGGSGVISGSGLENKIRLVRMDIAETTARPKSYMGQLAQRQSICRQCSTINAADATHCLQCGLDLPVNTFRETWDRDDIREPILREVREGAIIVAVMLVALYLASWMPLEIKGALLISTIIVLAWKGLRAITDK